MALGVTNITAAKPGASGPVFISPLGTTLPSDATTALGNSYTCLGSISDAGVTYAQEIDSSDIHRFGNDVVLSLQEGRTWTATFTLIDTLDAEVQKVIFGDSNVTGSLATGITAKGDGSELQAHVWVFEYNLRDGAVARVVFPNAKVSDVGDTVYADGDLVGYEVTITGMPDATGVCRYDYTKRSA